MPGLARRLLDRLRRAPAAPPVAVVYTMGKVGSSAVTRGLRQAGVVTHHIHTLDRARLMRMAADALAADEVPLRHVLTALAWRRDIIDATPAYRFVTLVRDPFARNLSAFFENLHRRRDGLSAASDPQALWQAYLAETDQMRGLAWFDREFRADLGIDVLAHPFDRAARFARFGNTVVFRADCPDAVKARVLSRLFGRRVRIGAQNVGADKPYAAAYRAVLALAVFPEDLAARVYGSDFVRHFWTEDERRAMMARWTGRTG